MKNISKSNWMVILLLEEFGPEVVYINWPKYVVADALNRLPQQPKNSISGQAQ